MNVNLAAATLPRTATSGLNLPVFVITAVPVSLVLLPSLWDALRITLRLGAEGRA